MKENVSGCFFLNTVYNGIESLHDCGQFECAS